MAGHLADKVALVTGAGRGIGRGIALRLAQEGADIAVVDRDGATATQTTQAVAEMGRRALALALNVADVGQVAKMVDRTVAHWGRIDILVNCAGVIRIQPFLEVSEEEWDRVIDINLKGLFFCCQLVGRHMAQRGRGSIINLSSIAGRKGRRDVAPYAASKAGVISVTQSAALSLAPYRVRVNAICPGVIETPMWDQIDTERARLEGLAPGEAFQRFVNIIPLGEAGRVEDVAALAVFLASDESAHITGQSINVCGGLEMD